MLGRPARSVHDGRAPVCRVRRILGQTRLGGGRSRGCKAPVCMCPQHDKPGGVRCLSAGPPAAQRGPFLMSTAGGVCLGMHPASSF